MKTKQILAVIGTTGVYGQSSLIVLLVNKALSRYLVKKGNTREKDLEGRESW